MRDATVLRAVSHPARLAILVALETGPASAATLARDLDLPFRAANHHVRTLELAGLLVLERTEVRRGGAARVFRVRGHGWHDLNDRIAELERAAAADPA